MPRENRAWPPAASKAGNLAPASTIMMVPFKVCEVHGFWRWEDPHPGGRLCLRVHGSTRNHQHGHARGAPAMARSRNRPCPCLSVFTTPGRQNIVQPTAQRGPCASAARPRRAAAKCAQLRRTAVSWRSCHASCRSHVAAQAGNQARGWSRPTAPRGRSRQPGTADSPHDIEPPLLHRQTGATRNRQHAWPRKLRISLKGQPPNESPHQRERAARKARQHAAPKTLKSHLRLSNLQKGRFDELLHNFA